MDIKIDSPSRERPDSQRASSLWVIAAAWGVMLVASILPDIILQESGAATDWLLWGKLGMVGLLIASTFVWKALQPLRGYLLILAVLLVAGWGIGWLADSAAWRDWFRGTDFTSTMLEGQTQKLILALVVIGVLLVLKRHPRMFYLTMGQTDAPAEPVPWLGIDKPVSWTRLGWIAALCISLGTLAFLVLAGAPALETVSKVLPLLPAIGLLAAMNAFSEEMSYRASLLATLQGAVSQPQALMLTAVYFGIAHFYGVPYGVVGVVMAGLLGWFLGKAMLETRGLFWPWFIHLCQDVLIFAFIALGSIVPGG